MFGSEEYYDKEKKEMHINNNLEAIVEIIIECSIKNIKEKERLRKLHYGRDRLKRDEKYSLNGRISSVIRASLKNNRNGSHWEDLVGYNLDDLIKKLKRTIPKGYCWQDFLEGRLHLEHIIPKNAFNFTKLEHADFKRCWALSNLRLLPARENMIKGKKLTRPFQPSLAL